MYLYNLSIKLNIAKRGYSIMAYYDSLPSLRCEFDSHYPLLFIASSSNGRTKDFGSFNTRSSRVEVTKSKDSLNSLG